MAELKKIFVDAGHGGSDPGAVKYEKEADLNIKVTGYMCEYLSENYECEVKKDITADSINTVVARANEWGADLFVSIHFNAGGGNGYEAWVYSEKNKELGEIFAKHVKAAGQNLRSLSVKYSTNLGVLRLTNMKAILNEGAFVDNKKDIQDWNENAELKKLGKAYAEAAAEYLDLPKKKATSSTAKKPTASKKSSGTTSKKATDPAKSFNKSLAGTYKVTAASGLNVRKGAGISKGKLVTIPKGTKVENYGYYTTVSGVKWLLVQFTYKSVKYTGFCSKEYLTKA